MRRKQQTPRTLKRKEKESSILAVFYKNFLFLFALLIIGSSFLWNIDNASSMMTTNRDLEQQQPSSPSSTHAEEQNEKFMLSCLKNALQNELPMSKTKKRMQKQCPNLDIAYTHHWDAGNTHLWNPNVEFRLTRMDALDKLNPSGNCTIWEVGAHKKADDSRALMKIYDKCHYHAYEPIPTFSTILRKNWAGESRMTVHGYGIGKADTTFPVPESLLAGQATYIADKDKNNSNSGSGGGVVTATIKSFDNTIDAAHGIPTLLHMNCEGCEWEFLVDAKQHGFIEKVPVVQIGWHNYGEVGMGTRVWQLCEIREMLSETHIMRSGLAFGWDRWELKKK